MGRGIPPHIDVPRFFVNQIASLSLGLSCVMEFTSPNNKIPIFLSAHSLVILKDEARYKWKHVIPARKSDNGVPRARRIVVFLKSLYTLKLSSLRF